MKVKDLKILLEKANDEMSVLIPLSAVFDGRFVHPCIEESGVSEMGIDNETLGITEDKKEFLLVPCGFFNVHEGQQAEMN